MEKSNLLVRVNWVVMWNQGCSCFGVVFAIIYSFSFASFSITEGNDLVGFSFSSRRGSVPGNWIAEEALKWYYCN